MARLNIVPDETPDPTRESSLYRDPTPVSQVRPRRMPAPASTRESTYSVVSPTPQVSSDKENQPESEDETPRPTRRSKDPMGPPKLPTPQSNGHGNKRRRLGLFNIPPESTQPVDPSMLIEDYVQKKFYDPDQDPIARRELKIKMRQNYRDLTERRDVLVQPQNNDLKSLIEKQSDHMREVRQTDDAVIDSRFLVKASEMALKKTQNGIMGDTAGQVDVDEFVSKCITFMRNGGVQEETDNEAPISTQARRQRRADIDSDDEEGEDIGDGLDWAVLGRRACFLSNRRPPVPNFLLGPLSVQKRIRAATQGRRGRLQTQARGPVTRPKSMDREDIEQAQNNTLTHMVDQVKLRIKDIIKKGYDEVEAADCETDDEFRQLLTSKRLRVRLDGEPAIDLLELVCNPHSFGQTVENLFYVSFLIKEGNARIDSDRHGLQIISFSTPRSMNENRAKGISKHQSVFAIDQRMWRGIIKAYNITEPLIPHRNDEGTTVTATGWYA